MFKSNLNELWRFIHTYWINHRCHGQVILSRHYFLLDFYVFERFANFNITDGMVNNHLSSCNSWCFKNITKIHNFSLAYQINHWSYSAVWLWKFFWDMIHLFKYYHFQMRIKLTEWTAFIWAAEFCSDFKNIFTNITKTIHKF